VEKEGGVEREGRERDSEIERERERGGKRAEEIAGGATWLR
jgi:hypothetical protein